jgi:5'-methylthioadenosine phosphorylase/purine-nucleoside phosphorylase
MTVSDLLGDRGETVRISDEELRAGVDQMMRISCAVAVS